jgi:hypothetical protein
VWVLLVWMHPWKLALLHALSPKIEHTSQNKTKYKLSYLVFFNNIFNEEFSLKIAELICASLQTKWPCFKKLFNSKKLLFFVITSRLVLGSFTLYHLLSHGICRKLWSTLCLPLSLLVFQTNQRAIGCWVMLKKWTIFLFWMLWLMMI